LLFSIAALRTNELMLEMPDSAAASDNKACVSESTLAVIRGDGFIIKDLLLSADMTHIYNMPYCYLKTMKT